jgi:hypothetical protein
MARGADVRSPAERSWWQLCRFSQQCSGAVKNGCSWRGREMLGRCDGSMSLVMLSPAPGC